MTDAWQGHETVAKIASSVTITTSGALDTFFGSGTAIDVILKNFTINKPKFDPAIIKLAGKDGNNKPNAAMETNTPDLAVLNGTFLLPKTALVDSILYGAGTSIGGTHTRYDVGKVPVQEMAILVNLEDSDGKEKNFVLDKCIISTDDITLTGPDGHYEWTGEWKCLPANFYGPESKN